MIYRIFLFLLAVVFSVPTSSAQPYFYEHEHFASRAFRHEIIAIFPFPASVIFRASDMRETSLDQLECMELTEDRINTLMGKVLGCILYPDIK